MENNYNIQENLDFIAKSEGANFQYQLEDIEKEYHETHDDQSNLAIKILSVVGGFLGMLAFMGFLFIGGLYNSAGGLVITGIVFIVASIVLKRMYQKILIDTVSISAFAIGLFMLALGMNTRHMHDTSVSVVLIVTSIFPIVFTRSYILVLVSILSIQANLIYLIFANEVFSLIHVYDALILALLTYSFLNESKFLANRNFLSQRYNPIRAGLVLSAIGGLAFVGQRGIYDFGIKAIWTSSLITIPLTLYVISRIFEILGVKETSHQYTIYALATLLLAGTALSPAISGALLVVLLSFLIRYKTGFALSIIALIYFISQYYYDLNLSLLTKSIILFFSGLMFFIFYLLMHKNLERNEKI